MIRSLLLAAAVLAAFAVPASAASVTQLSGSAGCFEMHGKQGCARGVGTEWTTAAVASPDGKNVYATSGIGSFGAVLSFKRDRKTGALKQLKAKRGCISSTGRAQQNLSSKKPCAKAPGLPQANDIAIAPDGLTVYTLAQAGFDDGQAVDVWRRDPATGRLAQVQCLTANAGNPGCTQVALDLPTKFALSGDGHRLIAAGSALTSFDVNGDGTLSNAVCQYKLEAQPGNLCDPAPRLEGVRVATEITASPEFTKLYLAGGQGGKGQISALNVDP
ncbi:MAG: Lactonase, 7-bladed beta-propeller, partial [Thermoleophilaceae bacterium]|nr:Lactonase, 7-bladed beta-propeller [Thermoleophilaceae bacterium]